MELILYQIDAFTDKLFKGNPAAVIPLKEWLPDDLLQAIALENNLSETAFFRPNGRDYDLRWFTPTREVKLCGHATLATAHVLAEHLHPMEEHRQQLNFHTLSGPLMVRRNKDGWYTMNFPADELELLPTPHQVKDALRITPIETYKGREDLLVIVETMDELLSIQPDFQQLQELDYRGVIVTAPGKNTDFASRCFYPNYGVNEDPVTGSAHTTLAPYWSKQLDKNDLSAIQCSSRTGHLHCRVLDERVEIGGQAVTFMEGKISLPSVS